jgi:hypothetical protein
VRSQQRRSGQATPRRDPDRRRHEDAGDDPHERRGAEHPEIRREGNRGLDNRPRQKRDQQTHDRERCGNRQDRPSQREDEGLSDHLLGEAAHAAAKRRADGELRRALGQSGEQEAAQVDPGQQEQDGREPEDQRHRLRILRAIEGDPEADPFDSRSRVEQGRPLGGAERGGDHGFENRRPAYGQFGGGLFERDVRAQASKDVARSRRPVRSRGNHRVERREQIHAGVAMEPAEPRWQDPDDREAHALGPQNLPDGGRVAAEDARPEPMADDHDAIARTGRWRVSVCQRAPDDGRHPERREATAGHERADRLRRDAIGLDGERHAAVVGAEVDERPFAPVELIDRRNQCQPQLVLSTAPGDANQSTGIRDRELLDKESIQDAEEGGVGADAECEDQDGSGGKAW